jgi:hypothetical protein
VEKCEKINEMTKLSWFADFPPHPNLYLTYHGGGGEVSETLTKMCKKINNITEK